MDYPVDSAYCIPYRMENPAAAWDKPRNNNGETLEKVIELSSEAFPKLVLFAQLRLYKQLLESFW